MGKIILLSVIVCVTSTAVLRPWIGIVSYYLLALLGPQYIWWWSFEGLRVSFWVALFTLAGVSFKVLKGDVDYRFLKTPLNAWLLVLWISIVISYYFGPFVNLYVGKGLGPEKIFSITNNIFLFYFCSVLVLNNLKVLQYLGFIFVGITAYMIYWANNQYLSQNWAQFNMGRLMGPYSIDGGSLYSDENVFAMLFVTGIPFLYFLSFQLQVRWQRYLLWGLIPLGWHAVFLTGSRGGLLGVGLITLLPVLKSKRKLLLVPLLVAFWAAYQWQAGDTMKQRSELISKYQGEGSAEMRIAAWKGGAAMIMSHPLTGVGLGSFVTALPRFYDTNPRVAHNTLVQFTAESGLGAGVAYLMILWHFLRATGRVEMWCRSNEQIPEGKLVRALNNASSVSFAGLVMCSLFLSLNIYEVFFFLLIFNNTLDRYCLTATEPINHGGNLAV
jgi:O-antigen ligase